MTGRILGIAGPTVAVDLPGLRLYDLVQVGESRLIGEAVRLEPGRAILQVYEDTRGLAVGEPAASLGRPLTVQLGPGLLSGMYDGLQRPLERLARITGPFVASGASLSPLDPELRCRFTTDRKPGDVVRAGECLGELHEGRFRHPVLAQASGTIAAIAEGEVNPAQGVGHMTDGSSISACTFWPVRRPRPCLKKLSPSLPLVTGQRVIDFLFPMARGGTAIFPGGFGTGKTILEQNIAKFASVDVVVYVGCGERGNEMAELLEEFAGLSDPWSSRPLMERTVVIANTSNMPVAAREASIYTAVAMAEYYRDLGCHVLLLADSISRWAEALREISASLEEMPGEESYPTYLSSRLAAFFERAGTVRTLDGRTGSLSMILSVSPPGGDFTEPVTQACLRTAGAFFMLDTSLAHRRHFPAINWFQSYSLYTAEMVRHFSDEISAQWGELRGRCLDLLQREEALREVAEIVGVEGLQDADRLLMRLAERIRQEFLCQNAYGQDAFSPPEHTVALIRKLVERYDAALARLKEGALPDELLSTETE
ncbi:V-type ATP synthase subunit A [Geomonas ferrireducens]|uniref:V-type ATP synthase subunit A n=1 Tax=Geomonas ferrireducens TaxID=2570227 RepID=UPI0010A77581|nr:V-type ATP synthase subunit A [Geomonas ferrireducens]